MKATKKYKVLFRNIKAHKQLCRTMRNYQKNKRRRKVQDANQKMKKNYMLQWTIINMNMKHGMDNF